MDSGSTPADPAPVKPASDPTSQAQDGLDTASAGAATANTGPTRGRSDGHAKQGLDTATAGAADATNELANAHSHASTQGQQGLDTATAGIANASNGIRDGNKVQPGQVGGNSEPSSGDPVKAAKPVGDQDGSTLSKTGNETKKDQTNPSTKGPRADTYR